MSQLTATEIIATKLFGWMPDDSRSSFPAQYREYHHYNEEGWRRNAAVRISDGKDVFESVHFPDFTHPRIQHYWVRRMEDALAERGLGSKYAQELVRSLHLLYDSAFDEIAVPCLRATTEQRVAAALKVIEEEGL